MFQVQSMVQHILVHHTLVVVVEPVCIWSGTAVEVVAGLVEVLLAAVAVVEVAVAAVVVAEVEVLVAAER